MLYRRKLKHHFLPIIDKENTNFENRRGIEIVQTNYTKRPTLKISESNDEAKWEFKTPRTIVNILKNDEQSLNFDFETLKKPFKHDELHPTECPNRSIPIYPKSPNSQEEFNLEPRFLNFSNDSQSTSSEKTTEVIEILPCDDFNQKFVDSDDEEIEKWDKLFQEYDMDSDKENRVSDSDDDFIDSDDEYRNSNENEDEDETSESVFGSINISNRKIVERRSLLLRKELSEIHEVDDETSKMTTIGLDNELRAKERNKETNNEK